MIKKVENIQSQKLEDNNKSRAVSLSLIIIVIRSIIFVLGYRMRQLNYTPSMPIAVSSCAIFIVLEIWYWVKASREDLSRVRKVQTFIVHIWSFLSFLGIGLTVNYNDIEPSTYYFLFQCALICNYSLSLLYFDRVYSRPPPSEQNTFLKNNDLISTVLYLFFSMYVGAFFDTLAFDKQSSFIFGILNIILVLYLIGVFLKSKLANLFKQGYLSQ